MGKPIRIRIRKYLNEKDHFEPYVEILDVDALGHEDLPWEYLSGKHISGDKVDRRPRCHYIDNYVLTLTWDGRDRVPAIKITDKWGHDSVLFKTMCCKREEFMKIYDILCQCAKRLKRLKELFLSQEEKNKKKYADWTGEEEITI